MTTPTENPPAFPVAWPSGSPESGMTLRDWFASQCIGQCIRNAMDADGGWDESSVAYHAYLIADAMIAARIAELEAENAWLKSGRNEPAEQVSDADAIRIWRLIEVLTDGEDDSVHVLCPNPDFNGLPNYAIECNGFWTDWQDRRFAADTQLECFHLAVADLRAALAAAIRAVSNRDSAKTDAKQKDVSQ